MGSLSTLNVFEGDVRITFDTNNVAEVIRAKRIIADMLRRGYALLIEVDGAYQRAYGFDEKVGEYVIADFDPALHSTEHQIPNEENSPNGQEQQEEDHEVPAEPAATPKQRGRRRVKMEDTNAVAIARSAGG